MGRLVALYAFLPVAEGAAGLALLLSTTMRLTGCVALAALCLLCRKQRIMQALGLAPSTVITKC